MPEIQPITVAAIIALVMSAPGASKPVSAANKKTQRKEKKMDALAIVFTLVVLVAMIVHVIRVLRYARSDDWKIDQRLSRYADR
jgi:hypothetical protein